MTSSTSHSERRVPALALKLLGVAVMTWAVCVAYTLWLNPEIRFYRQLAAVQDEWSRKMDREHGHKVVVFGGSSCMFSIVGEQMLEKYALPTVNRGLAAGMTVKIPALNAMQDLKTGDTLIVALEPAHFTAPIELTSMAVQFSFARRHSGWATRTALGLPGSGRVSALLALRPGSRHVLTLLGKIIQGRVLYRYQVADAWPSGWMRTDVRVPVSGPPGHGPRLSDDVRQFLSALNDWCLERGVRVAYSLPWGYTPSAQVSGFRKDNAQLLMQISEFVPVLKDPWLGADTNAGHFADTAWHLNEEGSRLRTDELGRAVKQWDVWSVKELHSIVSEEREF
jgi:hypothetical protein